MGPGDIGQDERNLSCDEQCGNAKKCLCRVLFVEVYSYDITEDFRKHKFS